MKILHVNVYIYIHKYSVYAYMHVKCFTVSKALTYDLILYLQRSCEVGRAETDRIPLGMRKRRCKDLN